MKLLVVGWDAATMSHISKYDLPFIQSLQDSGRLKADAPFGEAGYISSANAWTTLTTGATFDEHHILGFVYNKADPDSRIYRILSRIASQPFLPWPVRRILIGRILGKFCTKMGKVGKTDSHLTSADIEHMRVWELLPGKALIYGCPYTYPARSIDGVMVSGIPSPPHSRANYPMVTPRELTDTVYNNSYEGYHIPVKSPFQSDDVSVEEYIDHHFDRAEYMVEKFIDLYTNRVSDAEFGFLMLRFLDDTLHVTSDDDIIQSSYAKIDALTEQLADSVGAEDVLVLSDHGMRQLRALRLISQNKHDHDAATGVWAGSQDFGLERHHEVVPTILDFYDVNVEVPQQRDEMTKGEVDEQELHQLLEALGYA